MEYECAMLLHPRNSTLIGRCCTLRLLDCCTLRLLDCCALRLLDCCTLQLLLHFRSTVTSPASSSACNSTMGR